MNTNLFVPKKLNVGYQNRRDTYTGKLAYIVYYDEKGKLRKQASWDSWRDKNIPNDEFENTPMSGFMLNKHVGGYKYSWDYRKSYCRVYDPRGFEFEITIDNLLYILEFVDCSSKELKGKFVYAWDKTELVLLPVSSPDYTQIQDFTNKVLTSTLKDKDLVIGGEYLGKDNEVYVYLGKFNYYGPGFVYTNENNEIVNVKNLEEVPYKKGNYKNKVSFSYRTFDYGKYQWFAQRFKNDPDSYSFEVYKRLPKKIISCITEKGNADLDKIMEDLKSEKSFSPLDDSRTEIVAYTHDEFMKILKHNKAGYAYQELYHYGIFSEKGFNYVLKYDKATDKWGVEVSNYLPNYVLRESGLREGRELELHHKEYKELFNGEVNNRSYYNDNNFTYSSAKFDDEELFKILKPCYVVTYLKSGKLYKKHCYYVHE